MENQISIYRLADSVIENATQVAKAKCPADPRDAMARELGILSGILSLLPDTEENKRYLTVAAEYLKKELTQNLE